MTRALLLVWGMGAIVPCVAAPRAKLSRVEPSPDAELRAAIDAGDVARLRRALKHGGDPNARFRGSSPLEKVFRTGKKAAVPVVTALLDGGAHLDDSALWTALMDGDEHVFALFFARGLSVNRRVPDESEDWDKVRVVSLFECALGGAARPSFLRFLITRGVRVGEAELKAAANVRNRTAIALLLDAGVKPKSGDPFLLPVAARAGDAKLLARLLESGVKVSNVRGENEESPLHLACDADETARDERLAPLASRLKCARLLLDAGADVNVRDWRGVTPLMLAANKSVQAPMVELLLRRGADPNVRDASGQNAAFGAIPARFVAAKNAERFFPTERIGDSILVDDVQDKAKQIAQTPENLDTLRLLRDAGADLTSPATVPSVPVSPDVKPKRRYQERPKSSFLTPLHLAASADRATTIGFLLASGADVEAADANGHTPLHCAAGSDAPHAIASLLDAGANIEARDSKGLTPLLCACGGDYRGVLYYSPLAHSVMGSLGGVEATRVLIERGADTGATSAEGLTALSLSTVANQIEVARLLLRRGVYPDIAGKNGATPLCVAAGNGHFEIAQMLLARGANPDLRDSSGQTPRQLALQPFRLKTERFGDAPPSAYELQQEKKFEAEFGAPINAGRRKIAALFAAKTPKP